MSIMVKAHTRAGKKVRAYTRGGGALNRHVTKRANKLAGRLNRWLSPKDTAKKLITGQRNTSKKEVSKSQFVKDSMKKYSGSRLLSAKMEHLSTKRLRG